MTVAPRPRLAVARRIDHIAIATRDADTAAAWYAEHFGLTVTGDERVVAAGVRLVYLSVAGGDPDTDSMVQLVEPYAPGNVHDFIATRGEGLHHVCFAIDDIAAGLTGIGQSPTTIFAGGRDRRTCFLTEQPGGVLVELTEVLPVARP